MSRYMRFSFGQLAKMSLIISALCGVMLAQDAKAPAKPEPANWFAPTSEINHELPAWLRFTGEDRVRVEGFTGQGFKPNATDIYTLNRFRFGTEIKPTDWLSFDGQTQDARAFWKNQMPYGPPYQATWDLTAAYAKIGNLERFHMQAMVGRQSLAFGDERVIGTAPWNNTPRTYDAVRTTFQVGRLTLDALAATAVLQKDGYVGVHNLGSYIEGFYGKLDHVLPGGVIEPYFFYRRNPLQKLESGALAHEHQGITGARLAGKLPLGFDYNSEVILERGSIGVDSVSAWASHLSFGYLLPFQRSHKWRALTEYNFASGDHNPKDGAHNTFDTIYASNHDKYGLSDQIGGKNIHHIRSGVEFQPSKRLLASFRYSDYWLASSVDALYNTSGTVVARSATGSAGRWVGQELDWVGSFKATRISQVGVGYAYLMPGTFLKMTTPGQTYTYPYLFYSTRF